jgi:hypothetical protein
MRRFRFTISRWMAATAVLGGNIGLVRAYLLAERELFDFGFLILFALQLGLWRYLRTRGNGRRFWLGFEASGLAATLALLYAFSGPPLERLVAWYTDAASDLSYLDLPARVDDWLMQHWDWFLAVIYFLPELLAAALGGLLAACLFKVREERVGTTRPAPSVPASFAVEH